jgi:hypothetical protein
MNEVALQEKIVETIRGELKIAGGTRDQQIRKLQAQINQLQLEVQALKKCMVATLPGFSEDYSHVLLRIQLEENL